MESAPNTVNVTVTVDGPDGPRTATADLELVPARTARSVLTVGISVNPADYTVWYPKFPAAAYSRVFFPPGQAPAWTKPSLAQLPASVTRVGVSWKDRLTRQQIVDFADRIPAGRAVDLTWRHEPEPDWPLADYITGWTELRAAVDGHPNRGRIRLVNIHTLYASRHRAGINWRRWMLPGLADLEGWDCYRDTAFDTYEPVQSLFGLPALAAAEFGTRWMIPEWGATRCTWDPSGTGRALWFREGAAFLATHGCDTIGLWCATSQGGGLDYRPTDEPTAAAWRDIMATYN